MKILCSSTATTGKFVTQDLQILGATVTKFSLPGICSSLSENPSLVAFLSRMDLSSSQKSYFFKDKFAISPHLRLLLQIRLLLSKIIYAFLIFLVRVNLLKPTGHVMHQHFNIQQLYSLPTLYLCVLYLSENKQRLVPLTA